MDPHITVTQGLSGWFAVMVVKIDGFPEPYCSGMGRYVLQAKAIEEGQQWAKAEELQFVMPEIDERPARQDVVEQIKQLVPGIKVVTLHEFLAETKKPVTEADVRRKLRYRSN
jgi:hypothetical protein